MILEYVPILAAGILSGLGAVQAIDAVRARSRRRNVVRGAAQGPYRTMLESSGPDVAQLAFDLANDAVARERDRILTIVKVTRDVAGDDGERKIADAIASGIKATPLPMPGAGRGVRM